MTKPEDAAFDADATEVHKIDAIPSDFEKTQTFDSVAETTQHDVTHSSAGIPEGLYRSNLSADAVASSAENLQESAGSLADLESREADLLSQQEELNRQMNELAQQRAAQQAKAEDEAAALIEAQRAARDRRLGTVRPEPQPQIVTVEPKPKRTTDKFAGSLALFLLRVVMAGIIGIRGYQRITDLGATEQLFAKFVSDGYVSILAYGLAIGELVVAVLLFFGFATRLAGLLVAAVAICFLVFEYWGNFNPFNALGFEGELHLLVATVGVVLLFIGSGRWGIDAGLRLRRQRAREEGVEDDA